MELLSKRVADALVRASTCVHYNDGQLIHCRGDDKPGLSVIASGAAQVGVNGIDGVFVMTTQLRQGECFGEFTLFTDLPRTHDVSAVGMTDIYQLSRYKFDQLNAAYPELSEAILTVTLWRNHMLLETLDAVRRLPVLERTARILSSMPVAPGAHDRVRCRQSDLAFTLGVTRVSLSKALRELSDLGLIKPGYGFIEIVNRDQFNRWIADHCGTTLLQTRM